MHQLHCHTFSHLCFLLTLFPTERTKGISPSLSQMLCVTPAPVSPAAIARLLLSTLCLCGKQFMRVMDLSSLFANIFQFIVPVCSSAEFIVLQIGTRETLCLLRLCHGGVLLHGNELCRKGTVQDCFILTETGCSRVVKLYVLKQLSS